MNDPFQYRKRYRLPKRHFQSKSCSCCSPVSLKDLLKKTRVSRRVKRRPHAYSPDITPPKKIENTAKLPSERESDSGTSKLITSMSKSRAKKRKLNSSLEEVESLSENEKESSLALKKHSSESSDIYIDKGNSSVVQIPSNGQFKRKKKLSETRRKPLFNSSKTSLSLVEESGESVHHFTQSTDKENKLSKLSVNLQPVKRNHKASRTKHQKESSEKNVNPTTASCLKSNDDLDSPEFIDNLQILNLQVDTKRRQATLCKANRKSTNGICVKNIKECEKNPMTNNTEDSSLSVKSNKLPVSNRAKKARKLIPFKKPRFDPFIGEKLKTRGRHRIYTGEDLVTNTKECEKINMTSNTEESSSSVNLDKLPVCNGTNKARKLIRPRFDTFTGKKVETRGRPRKYPVGHPLNTVCNKNNTENETNAMNISLVDSNSKKDPTLQTNNIKSISERTSSNSRRKRLNCRKNVAKMCDKKFQVSKGNSNKSETLKGVFASPSSRSRKRVKPKRFLEDMFMYYSDDDDIIASFKPSVKVGKSNSEKEKDKDFSLQQKKIAKRIKGGVSSSKVGVKKRKSKLKNGKEVFSSTESTMSNDSSLDLINEDQKCFREFSDSLNNNNVQKSDQRTPKQVLQDFLKSVDHSSHQISTKTDSLLNSPKATTTTNNISRKKPNNSVQVPYTSLLVKSKKPAVKVVSRKPPSAPVDTFDKNNQNSNSTNTNKSSSKTDLFEVLPNVCEEKTQKFENVDNLDDLKLKNNDANPFNSKIVGFPVSAKVFFNDTQTLLKLQAEVTAEQSLEFKHTEGLDTTLNPDSSNDNPISSPSVQEILPVSEFPVADCKLNDLVHKHPENSSLKKPCEDSISLPSVQESLPVSYFPVADCQLNDLVHKQPENNSLKKPCEDSQDVKLEESLLSNTNSCNLTDPNESAVAKCPTK